MLSYGFIFKAYMVFYTLALINCFTIISHVYHIGTAEPFIAHPCKLSIFILFYY